MMKQVSKLGYAYSKCCFTYWWSSSAYRWLNYCPSFPGTTCLIALLSDRELTVANVGDSRGVLCDKDGNAVALSHDHKPYQLKERKRIKRAGELACATSLSSQHVARGGTMDKNHDLGWV